MSGQQVSVRVAIMALAVVVGLVLVGAAIVVLSAGRRQGGGAPTPTPSALSQHLRGLAHTCAHGDKQLIELLELLG